VNVLLASLVQSAVPEGVVGRVSSVFGSASQVATPVGALAGVLGPTPVVGAGGAFMLVLAAYWVVVPSLRRMPAVDAVSIDATA
jgi:hypothetical protein